MEKLDDNKKYESLCSFIMPRGIVTAGEVYMGKQWARVLECGIKPYKLKDLFKQLDN